MINFVISIAIKFLLQVDYTLFNNTYEVDTPLCSARELSEMRAESQSQQGEAGECFFRVFTPPRYQPK